MRNTFTRLLALAVLAGGVIAAPSAMAQHHGNDYHGRDYGHFTPQEHRAWQGGRWEHGWHDNRYAWWWIVDGFWYFYPVPVYPYPTYVPPAIIVQQPPPVPSGLPPAAVWYYCDNPQGYYPYVASCNVPWRTVPSTPPQ